MLAERRSQEILEERGLREEYSRIQRLAGFEVPFDLYLQARTLPNRFLRNALKGLFGVRPTASKEGNIALLAYWSKRYLEEKGVRGGVLTASILRGMEQRGGDWKEGLALWLRLRTKRYPRNLPNLDLPFLHPVWLEAPRDVEGALGALSSFAKDPRLCKRDRETLYALKDSLMVKLWSERRLRFVKLLARPRPLPKEEALAEAYRSLWEEVEEVFAKGGYEALESLLSYWEPGDLPKAVDPEWAEERAKAWLEAYRAPWDPVVPRAVLTLPPRLLAPLLGLGKPQKDDWEEVLAERPHLLDPYANYLLTALIRWENGSFIYHFPYRKARRYRILSEEEGLLKEELPADVRIGRKVEAPPSDGDLKAYLEEMGYSPCRFPCGLEFIGGRREAGEGMESLEEDPT